MEEPESQKPVPVREAEKAEPTTIPPISEGSKDWSLVSEPARQEIIRLRTVEDLRKRDKWLVDHLGPVIDKLPEVIDQGLHYLMGKLKAESGARWWSLVAHLLVLLIGTAAMLWLGLQKVVEGETLVAILGPLYTYVLVNLRQLTPGQEKNEKQAGG